MFGKRVDSKLRSNIWNQAYAGIHKHTSRKARIEVNRNIRGLTWVRDGNSIRDPISGQLFGASL